MTLATRFATQQSASSQDGLRDIVDGYMQTSEPTHTSVSAPEHDYPTPKTQPSRSIDEGSKPLTTRESVELFQETVDAARQNIQQSLAGSGKAGEIIRPKLTVDLSRRNLGSVPSEVVTIIRQDVERLQLAHNQLRAISSDFASCFALKYLNLRDNKFHEIPSAIFSLPQLEILDLSRNSLTEISEDIKNLKALRVFSIHHNRITDLPVCLGTISALRMLKLNGNPLKQELIESMHGYENSMSPSTPAMPDNENEKDRLITSRVVEYLKSKRNARDDFSDGPLETPRALSRFPTHPNDSGYLTSGSESTSAPRSPGIHKPLRSHHRGSSSHYTASQSVASRRPGLAPLTLSNERNRSNSESVLQAAQNNRTKRMGIVPTKKPTDLEVLDENRASRNSYHLRGQSHSSALRNVHRPGDPLPMDENSRDGRQQGTFIRRLSSVPEQRQNTGSNDSMIESAKGVLYALYLVQPSLALLVSVIQDGSSKRASLERYQYQASVQLEHLDQSLHDWSITTHRSQNARRIAKKTVSKATHASILVYDQISGLLLKNIGQLVADGDRKYIRTLMLMLYGSFNEERNARRTLKPMDDVVETQNEILQTVRPPTREKQINRDDALTPTQNFPTSDRKWRNGSTDQPLGSLASAVLSSQGVPNPPKISHSHSNLSSRSTSRSSSRAGFQLPSSNSSVASTPRSGEAFGAATLTPHSRNGSANMNPELKQQDQLEQDLFERIYVTLNKAAEQGLHVIPYLEPRFLNSLEQLRRQWLPVNVLNLWNTIISRTRHCGELSEALKRRLDSLKLNDPEARNAPDFWRLATRFTDAYGNLLASLREARQLNQMDADLRHRLRPVHKSIVDAGTLIQNSPWEHLTKESQPPSQVHSRAPTPVQNGYHTTHAPSQIVAAPIPPPSMATHQAYQHRRAKGSNGSSGEANLSPKNLSVPATPLSAALGPAAQATVPSTAAEASSLSGIFRGDVYQRAEKLLQQEQTMFRRPTGGAP